MRFDTRAARCRIASRSADGGGLEHDAGLGLLDAELALERAQQRVELGRVAAGDLQVVVEAAGHVRPRRRCPRRARARARSRRWSARARGARRRARSGRGPPAAWSTTAVKPVMAPERTRRRMRSAAALALRPATAPRRRCEARPLCTSSPRIARSMSSMAAFRSVAGGIQLDLRMSALHAPARHERPRRRHRRGPRGRRPARRHRRAHRRPRRPRRLPPRLPGRPGHRAGRRPLRHRRRGRRPGGRRMARPRRAHDRARRGRRARRRRPLRAARAAPRAGRARGAARRPPPGRALPGASPPSTRRPRRRSPG